MPKTLFRDTRWQTEHYIMTNKLPQLHAQVLSALITYCGYVSMTKRIQVYNHLQGLWRNVNNDSSCNNSFPNNEWNWILYSVCNLTFSHIYTWYLSHDASSFSINQSINLNLNSLGLSSTRSQGLKDMCYMVMIVNRRAAAVKFDWFKKKEHYSNQLEN